MGLVIALLSTAWLLPAAQAAPDRVDPLRRDVEKARKHEQAGQWPDARDIYEKVLHDKLPHARRTLQELKERYQLCLRHIYQARRSQDKSFRREVLHQPITVALQVYDEVLAKIQANYVDKDKTDLTRLFQQGLDELRLALDDGAFLRRHLRGVRRERVRAFRSSLAATWQDTRVTDRAHAREQVKDVALAAQRELGIKPTVVIMEFACGACNSLDEYTVCLTPAEVSAIYASLKGELVSVGVEPRVEGHKVMVAQVLMGSPADLASPALKANDRILRIDRKSVDHLSQEAVEERLRGEAGTSVELEVLSEGDEAPHILVLTREPVVVPSVIGTTILSRGVGYFQLIGFQDTTVEEMDKAIRVLEGRGMKVLIMDLRGNPGGSFPVAVQVAERFLSAGVIVSTQSQVEEHNKKYEANNLGALSVPLVVLVDGDTASAAEVVAGAFKDNRRATLVGETTFGKGCIQGVLKLDTVPAGLRITLARFFSPRGQAYSDLGIVPDRVVPHTSLSGDDDQRNAAVVIAARHLPMQ
jgi:carboxyl-terminal processing protease